MPMKCKAHILRDWKREAAGAQSDEFGRAKMDEYRRRNYVAFTCLLYNRVDGMLYCGITAYDADIFYKFDPRTGEWTSMGWAEVGEQYDVKIHRSLTFDTDGTIYGATACLHDVSRRLDAPGGKIFTFDPATNRYEVLSTPVKYDYIQTITMDTQRRLIYGLTYPVFKFFKYDIDADRVTDFDFIGSITHISALDDRGRFWGTWHWTKHCLFCYDPEADEITWFNHSIPNGPHGRDIMYPGAGPVDCMINGGDGYLYIGSTLGELIRLNPDTAACDYLGKPFDSRRMPGLMVGKDGLIYGCGGDGYAGQMFTYDRETNAFTNLGAIYDPELDTSCYRTHDLTVDDENVFYVAETDNPDRSGYLWECRMD